MDSVAQEGIEPSRPEAAASKTAVFARYTTELLFRPTQSASSGGWNRTNLSCFRGRCYQPINYPGLSVITDTLSITRFGEKGSNLHKRLQRPLAYH
jgi:hypothetical protein